MKSKSQQYADVVFPNVQDIADRQRRGDERDMNSTKYKGLCKRAGALVRTSGLMQALAFFEARSQRKGESHHGVFLDHLQDELGKLQVFRLRRAGTAGHWILDEARACPLPRYMVLTREVLQLCNWHKRLADTLIEGTADEHDDEEGDPCR